MKDDGGGTRPAGRASRVRRAAARTARLGAALQTCQMHLNRSGWLTLYACQLLSTYQIGRITGDNLQRVNWVLRKAGVPVNPRGTGRPRAGRDDRARHLDDLMTDMYLRRRKLSTTQIAGLVGIPAPAVRYRLLARGVPMRTRGGNNREDRIAVPQDELADLYVQAGLSADEVGQMLGVSRRVVLRSAHDAGLPVRVGGAPPQHGPSEIELIQALYADTIVSEVLTRHGVPRVPLPGPIWQRFPAPHNLTAELATELYSGCGLGLHHIELLPVSPPRLWAACCVRAGCRCGRQAGGRHSCAAGARGTLTDRPRSGIATSTQSGRSGSTSPRSISACPS